MPELPLRSPIPGAPDPDREVQQMDAFLDVVVQRLFATGMGIEAIVAQLDNPELADRLARHVTDLDETTEEIRRAIGLRDGTEAGSYEEQRVPSTASAADVVF